jgi:hypothetical protein
MTNFSHVSCRSQHRQILGAINIYHVCNILYDLTIMLDILVITNIATFDFSHDGHIQLLYITGVF